MMRHRVYVDIYCGTEKYCNNIVRETKTRLLTIKTTGQQLVVALAVALVMAVAVTMVAVIMTMAISSLRWTMTCPIKFLNYIQRV